MINYFEILHKMLKEAEDKLLFFRYRDLEQYNSQFTKVETIRSILKKFNGEQDV